MYALDLQLAMGTVGPVFEDRGWAVYDGLRCGPPLQVFRSCVVEGPEMKA